jgi:hypothetical protein
VEAAAQIQFVESLTCWNPEASSETSWKEAIERIPTAKPFLMKGGSGNHAGSGYSGFLIVCRRTGEAQKKLTRFCRVRVKYM